MFLISCSNVSSFKDNPTKSQSKEQTTTKRPIPTTTQAPTTTEAIVSTELFETVYFPYVNREKPFLFEAVKAFAQAQSSNYIVEIIEQADQNPTITLTDENDNYIFFNFSPANDMNVLMLILVSYHDVSTNTEVSLSNFSTDGSRRYDTFTIHTLGEKRDEIKNPNEQRKFLFDR